jgi:chaperone modulatory protein CbpM
MRIELTEMLWFEEHSISLAELSELCALPQSLLQELVGGGVVLPLEAAGSEPRFGAQALNAARAAKRLRDDFDLDASGLMLALGLLDRVHELEQEIRALRARLPGPFNQR